MSKRKTSELIPDRRDYKAGDTAEILVQAPFYPAEGVLTVQRSGLVKLERFRMETAYDHFAITDRGGLDSECDCAG